MTAGDRHLVAGLAAGQIGVGGGGGGGGATGRGLACEAGNCGRPYLDDGRGAPRRFCSTRCGTRERVRSHRAARPPARPPARSDGPAR